MKRYKEYKDSGVEWIGEIPSHWLMLKVAHTFTLIGSGTTPKAGSPEFYENGTIKWINTGDLNDNLLLGCTKCVTKKAIDEFSSLKVHPTGSLIIAMYGATIGKVAITTFEACTNQACCVLNGSNKLLIKFAFYWFQSNKSNIISLSFGGGQPNISQDIIRNIRICTPTTKEQQLIVSFLDEKVLQIDSLIEKKKQLIDLLKEERAAVINQAVTKGINPNAEMKDSGIEWLGEIPMHWKITKLKREVTKLTDGAHVSPDLSSKDFPFVSTVNINEGKIDFENSLKTSKESYENLIKSGCKPCKGDILFSKDGTIGKTAIVEDDFDFVVASSLIIIFCNEFHLDNTFCNYMLQSNVCMSQIESLLSGTALKRIAVYKIADIIFSLPPLQEQKQIVTNLNKKVSDIDDAIEHLSMEINLIEEYRAALINEAVTGKICVENV